MSSYSSPEPPTPGFWSSSGPSGSGGETYPYAITPDSYGRLVSTAMGSDAAQALAAAGRPTSALARLHHRLMRTPVIVRVIGWLLVPWLMLAALVAARRRKPIRVIGYGLAALIGLNSLVWLLAFVAVLADPDGLQNPETTAAEPSPFVASTEPSTEPSEATASADAQRLSDERAAELEARAEADRIAVQQAADQAEAERVAAEQAAAAQAEAVRVAAEQAAAAQAEAERVAAEQAAAAQAEAERVAAEQAAVVAAQLDAERVAAEQAAAAAAAAQIAAEDAAPSNVYYANCAAVRDAGAAPIYRGDPGYSSKLDRDGDGVACET